MQRCMKCVGTKKIAPLGGIKKDCDACKGTGMVNADITQDPQMWANNAVSMKNANRADKTHAIQVINHNVAQANTPQIDEKPHHQESVQNLTDNIAAMELIKKKPGRKAGWNKVVNPV